MIIAEELVRTGNARVGSETKKDIVSFLIELRNQGSPKLKKAISFVVDQIKKGNLLP
jgi:hypothetical protein